MAKNQGRINLGVGFNVDKSGLISAFNDLKQQLQSLQNLTVSDLGFTKSTKEAKEQLESLKGVAKQVEVALEQSFNKDLGTTNITKFNQVLTASGTNIKTVVNSLNNMGTAGKKAANTLTAELLTTNKHIRETSKWIDKMAETMSNTVRWSIASTALNSMTGAVQKAYGFTKQLDASLNDIMIVTDKSADDMARFAKQANTAAKNLGAVTTDYTKASLIYYQQGLSDQEVAARTETTMKVANVTGQGADAVSEQLTAVWNGYKVNSQEAELYIDKLSAVAATTAADLEELSTGMSRVASAANIMGVDIDQLNAQLATIVSVTREAPESIGTALKTVYARMSDIEAGLDTETTLGEYTKQMAEMGINTLDANGNLRDMGDVVEEIGSKWNTLSRNQQTALAQTIAGTRQYSRMMALFDNWDMYESAKSTSQGAAGTLQAQNEEYMESMEAHLNKLQAETEELYQTLFDADSLKPLINGLTSIVGLVENIIESLSGGQGLVGVLGTIGLNVFGDKLTMGISKGIRNIKGEIDNLNEEKAQANLISQLKQDLAKSGIDTSEMSKDTIEDIVNLKKEQLKVEKYLSEEQKQQANDLIKEKAELENQKIDLKKSRQRAAEIFKNITDKDVAKLTGEQSSAELRNKQFTLDLKDDSKYYSQLATQWDVIQDLARQEKNVRHSKEYYSSREDEYAAEAQQISKNWTGVQSSEAYDTAISKQATARARALEKTKQEEDLLLEKQVAIEEILDRNVTLFKDLSSQAKQLNDTGIFTDEDQKRLQQIVNQMNNLAEVTDAEELSDTEIKHVAEALRDVSIYGKKASDEIDNIAKTLENGDKAAADLEKKLQQLKDTNDKLVNSFKVEEVVSSFVNLAGSVRSVGEGITQLQRLGSIWSNDDLTTGEKVLQTVSSLSIALPMLVSGISGVGSALKGLNAARAAFTASLGMSTAMTLIDTKVQDAAADQAKENAFWKTILKNCEDELTDEQIDSIATTLAQNEALDDNTKAVLKNIAAKKLANGQEVGGMEKVGSKDLWKTFGDKLGGTIKEVVTKHATALIIAAFVAVAAAAVAGAYAFIDNWHKKEQKALAETKKLAKEAADNTKLLKESYDQLSASVDKYTEITTSIDDMVAGTQEYRDAIHEANDELLNMIQKYPELSDQIVESTEHTGLLVLKTEEALENILALENQKVTRAQAAEYGLQAQVLQAEQDVAIANEARNIKTGKQTGAEIGTGTAVGLPLGAVGAGLGYAAAGGITTAATAAGATVGSAVPVIGTIVGAIVGLAAGAIITVATTSEDIQSSNEELMMKAAKLYNENNALFSGTKDEVKTMLAEELDIDDKALIDSLYDNQDAIKELSATIKGSNLAEEQYRIQQADRYLSSMGIQHEHQGNISKELKLTDEKVAPYKDQVAKMTNKAVSEYYAEQMEWTHIKNKAGKGEFEYVDANGEVQNKAISNKTLKALVAEMMALEGEIEADAPEVVSAIDKVAKTGIKAVDAQLANVVTQQEINLKNLTESERKLFAEALANLSTLSAAELDALGITGINVLETYGRDSISALQGLLDRIAADNINNAQRRAEYEALFTQGGLFENSDLSFASREMIAQLYGNLDATSVDALTSIFSSLGEEADDFIALLPSLSAQGIDAFKENLVLESEFSHLLLDPIFTTFISGVKDSFDLYGQFNKASHQENVAFLESVSGTLHHIGDTISADDYVRLPAKLKTFFTETSTGLYALTEQAEKFHEIAKEDPLKELKNSINNTKQDLLEKNRKYNNNDRKQLEQQYTSVLSEAQKLEIEDIDSYIKNIKNAPIAANYDYVTVDGKLKLEKIQKGIKGYKQDAVDWAKNVLLFLSEHEWAGQTGESALEVLENEGYAIEYWQSEIEKGNYHEGMIRDLSTLMDQYISSWSSQTFEKTEDITKEIEDLNKSLVKKQESIAQQAGSLSKFEELIADEYITDDDIIEKYRKYWQDVIPQKFAASVDYSFELKTSEEAVESLTKELNQYEEAYNNAFGASKIELLQAQIPVLQQLNQEYRVQNILLARQAEFYKTNTLQHNLAAAGVNLDQVEFGKNGEILNYTEIMQAAYEYIEDTNPETGIAVLNDLVSALNTYGNTIGQILGNNDLIKENLIAEFDATLQIQLDTGSAIREYNQFLRDFADYGADLGGKTLAGLDAEDLAAYGNELDRIETQLIAVDQQEFDAATAYAKKVELRQQWEEKIRETKAYLISLEEKQIEALNTINETYQEQVNYLETIHDFYQQNLELQKLMHGENMAWIEQEANYEKATNAKIMAEQASRGQLLDNKSRLETYIAEAKVKIDAEIDPEKKEALQKELFSTEEFKTLTSNFQESIKNWQGSISEAIEAVNSQYLAAIDSVFYEFEQNLTNNKGLQALKDEFDWTKQMNDQYLDSVNKEFGISSFERNVNKEININTSITAQQRLNQLREQELEILRREDKLTQYDLDRANKRLDVLKAQIALEDAQQDKSQMRLVRGSDGSYGYQYVADENKLTEATEALATAQNELYNLDVQEYEDNLDRMYELYTEFINKVKTLADDADGFTEADFASLSPFIQEIEGAATRSSALFGNISSSINDIFGNAFSGEALNAKVTEIVSATRTGLAEMASTIATEGLNLDLVMNAILGTVDEATGERAGGFTEIWKAAKDELIEVFAGVDGEDGLAQIISDLLENALTLGEGENAEIFSLEDLLAIDVEARKEEAENYVEDVTETIQQGWDNLTTSVEKYQSAVTSALSLDVEKLYKDYPGLSEIIHDGTVSHADAEVFLDDEMWLGDSFNNTDTLNRAIKLAKYFDSLAGNGSTKWQEYVQDAYAQWLASTTPQVPENSSKPFLPPLPSKDAIAFSGEDGYNSTRLEILKWLLNGGGGGGTGYMMKHFQAFDTGGYTGEWGPSGRVAMLHEKELVLNQADTENILTAVDTIRSISNALNNNMLAALLDKLSAGASAMVAQETTKDMKIEQDVHIEAIFPNVSVAEEIEAAFNDIIDMAAERITKNTRG